MADWSLLRSALGKVDGSIRFSWSELDALVGGLPPSAARHRAWWSGDRPHVNAWKSAGFAVIDLALGQEVTFVRGNRPRSHEGIPTTHDVVGPGESAQQQAQSGLVDLLLVTCVKEKLATPAAAQDLYVSTLFKKQRSYAERSRLPWYILSAEHGLVAPTEWLAPYERYLPDTPRSYRAAWGAWVVERLELLFGRLDGRVVEVHAGAAYVEALRSPLDAKGAAMLEPLQGLSMGERLRWYGSDGTKEVAQDERHDESAHAEAEDFHARLIHRSGAISPAQFLATGATELKLPGLYSWWVDESGAADLTEGLGLEVRPGLIYAGLAGATRWPSGRRSSNTLWSRIAGMHLGGRHEFSTFRRTLGSILASTHGESNIDEEALTIWMHEHLKVLAIPFDDADTLGRLERDVLQSLDPPLNLMGMPSSPVRTRVTELRRPHGRRSGSDS